MQYTKEVEEMVMNGYPRFGWVDILRFQQSIKNTL